MPSNGGRNGRASTALDLPAPALLKKWRTKQKLASFAAAGRELGVPWFRYRRWELGECVPHGVDMAMLEKRCGVSTDAWRG